MGTRHLIAVYIDGEPRIAQYGQWDGYPEGQGETVRHFLANTDLTAFKESVRNCQWITDKEISEVEATPNWSEVYPHLSRNAEAEILDMVHFAKGLTLSNAEDFAGDGLFCEWAYVIDFDQNVLEVYEGFHKGEVTGRYKDFETEGEYSPVSLLASWPLDQLPDQDTFLKTLEPCDA